MKQTHPHSSLAVLSPAEDGLECYFGCLGGCFTEKLLRCVFVKRQAVVEVAAIMVPGAEFYGEGWTFFSEPCCGS